MANTLRLKRSAVSGRVPATTDLSLGEVAINTNDGRVFLKKDDGTEAIVEVIADDGAGKVGIGTTSPDGTLHVHTATAGSVTANANADNLIVENSGAGGISILTPNASAGGLFFGSPGDNIGAALRWNHDNNEFQIGPDKLGAHLRLNSGDGLERMRINNAGRVGIGTTSPAKQLHIHNTSTTEAQIQLTDSGTGSTGSDGMRVGWNGTLGQIYVYENADLRFATNNTERMRIDNSGKVGIGTTSPTTKLHVQQSAVTSAPSRTAALYLENNANCEIQFVGNSSNDCQLRFGTSSNSFKGAIEYQLDNNALLAYVNGSERMRIDSLGRVGIGTSSPSERLHVQGSVVVDAGTSGRIDFGDVGTNYGRLYASSSGTYIGSYTNDPLILRTNHIERMRVTSSGNVGIGTSSPGKELDVQGSIRSVGTSATIGLPVGTTAQRPGSPAQGDLRFNSTDTAAEIYDGSAWSAVGSGGGATGGGSDQWAVEHDNTITTSYTIGTGKNVISAGPLTVNSGAVVTVPSGSNWVIV